MGGWCKLLLGRRERARGRSASWAAWARQVLAKNTGASWFLLHGLAARPGQKKVPALFPLLSSSLRGGHARAERRSQWRDPIQASDSQHPAAARRDKSCDEPLTALQEQVAEQPTRPKSKSSQNKIGGGKCEGRGGTWLLLLLGPEKAPCLRMHTAPENAENDFENVMPAAQLAASPTPFHTTCRHTPAH